MLRDGDPVEVAAHKGSRAVLPGGDRGSEKLSVVAKTSRQCAGSLDFAAPNLSHHAHAERIDMTARTAPWTDVLDFWFPEGRSLELGAETHRDHWSWRLHAGADHEIVARFTYLTRSAASGGLDDWADDPESRLALIILLDQFSRSLWRGVPRLRTGFRRAAGDQLL